MLLIYGSNLYVKVIRFKKIVPYTLIKKAFKDLFFNQIGISPYIKTQLRLKVNDFVVPEEMAREKRLE